MKKFKKGERVFSITDGYVEISECISSDWYAVWLRRKTIHFNYEGKVDVADKHPSIFHSAKEAAEYFLKIHNEETGESLCMHDPFINKE